jgi:hypothetical protein
MDNRIIDVTSEGDISPAIKLIWNNAAGGMAKHYKITKLLKVVDYFGEPETTHHFDRLIEDENGTPTLILLWSKERDSNELPFPLDMNESIEFINAWLGKVDRGSRPDIDGDCDGGWRVFTEQWGHVAGHSYSIVAIQPAWAMYGK